MLRSSGDKVNIDIASFIAYGAPTDGTYCYAISSILVLNIFSQNSTATSARSMKMHKAQPNPIRMMRAGILGHHLRTVQKTMIEM